MMVQSCIISTEVMTSQKNFFGISAFWIPHIGGAL